MNGLKPSGAPGWGRRRRRIAALEALTPGVVLRGLLPNATVSVVAATWFGDNAVELTFKAPDGKVAQEVVFRHDEPRLEVVEAGRPWAFDGDGATFRLVSEANRIRLAHLFDPVLAVHTSEVELLPHQITAVYQEMLPRQPPRFLLADDPGAGKTIMTGLLIWSWMARGDLARCLVVCPGSLAEQWQDELYRRFGLPFDILTNDKLEAARTGNYFLEQDLVVARLDKLSRNSGPPGEARGPGRAGTSSWSTRRTRCRPPSSVASPATPRDTAWASCCRPHAPLPAPDRDAPTTARRRTSNCSWRSSTATGSRAARAMARMPPTRWTSCGGWSRSTCSSSTPRPCSRERIAYTVPYKLPDEEAEPTPG
ncbi:MAG: SNF2-related protein [Chloroflexota bacterium]